CFTAPPEKHDQVIESGKRAGVTVTHIGNIEEETGLKLYNASGTLHQDNIRSFDHFAAQKK
ncbi:MAG: thiamine-phosphate kinase, partial [Oxalobacter sp.]|nr:thiamine-phosphate kinase [Oxalobacter sp.]